MFLQMKHFIPCIIYIVIPDDADIPVAKNRGYPGLISGVRADPL